VTVAGKEQQKNIVFVVKADPMRVQLLAISARQLFRPIIFAKLINIKYPTKHAGTSAQIILLPCYIYTRLFTGHAKRAINWIKYAQCTSYVLLVLQLMFDFALQSRSNNGRASVRFRAPRDEIHENAAALETNYRLAIISGVGPAELPMNRERTPCVHYHPGALKRVRAILFPLHYAARDY